MKASSHENHRQDFQFFPPKLAELQERELAAWKVCESDDLFHYLVINFAPL